MCASGLQLRHLIPSVSGTQEPTACCWKDVTRGRGVLGQHRWAALQGGGLGSAALSLLGSWRYSHGLGKLQLSRSKSVVRKIGISATQVRKMRLHLHSQDATRLKLQSKAKQDKQHRNCKWTDFRKLTRLAYSYKKTIHRVLAWAAVNWCLCLTTAASFRSGNTTSAWICLQGAGGRFGLRTQC